MLLLQFFLDLTHAGYRDHAINDLMHACTTMYINTLYQHCTASYDMCIGWCVYAWHVCIYMSVNTYVTIHNYMHDLLQCCVSNRKINVCYNWSSKSDRQSMQLQSMQFSPCTPDTVLFKLQSVEVGASTCTVQRRPRGGGVNINWSTNCGPEGSQL